MIAIVKPIVKTSKFAGKSVKNTVVLGGIGLGLYGLVQFARDIFVFGKGEYDEMRAYDDQLDAYKKIVESEDLS